MSGMKGSASDVVSPAISQRDDIAALFATLKDLSRHAPQVLARSATTAGDMQQITGYVEEIRRLLVELCALQMHGAGPSSLPAVSCGALADRYFALEGMIKEMRNDILRR